MGIEVKVMSEVIKLSHNVSVLIYHYVCPSKYRKVVYDKHVDEVLKEICLELEERYDMRFLEIGTDKNHVQFLVQSVPKNNATELIRVIKSITAREIFARCPEEKKSLWGGEFWSDGYYVSTVGRHGSEEIISKHVRNQGREQEYTSLICQQVTLFE